MDSFILLCRSIYLLFLAGISTSAPTSEAGISTSAPTSEAGKLHVGHQLARNSHTNGIHSPEPEGASNTAAFGKDRSGEAAKISGIKQAVHKEKDYDGDLYIQRTDARIGSVYRRSDDAS
ncbi:hypothetical protein V3C99_000944 [Haemonchus contortus]